MRMFIFEERVCQPAPWWRGRCPRRSRRSHLRRSFASLSIAPGHQHEEDASIEDIDNDDEDNDDYVTIVTMTGIIKTLTMCPGCRRSSLDWWLVIFKQRLGKVFLLKYLTVVILPWVTIEVLHNNWRYLCLFLFLLFQLNVHVPVPPLRESEKKRIRKMYFSLLFFFCQKKHLVTWTTRSRGEAKRFSSLRKRIFSPLLDVSLLTKRGWIWMDPALPFFNVNVNINNNNNKIRFKISRDINVNN